MKLIKKIKKVADKQEIRLFTGFYALSTLIYYTANWISYGAFSGGHPSYFDLEEFLSAAGIQFAVSFIFTVPIWYFVFIIKKNVSLKYQLVSHVFLLPIYIICCYFSIILVKSFFNRFIDLFTGSTEKLFLSCRFGLCLIFIFKIAVI